MKRSFLLLCAASAALSCATYAPKPLESVASARAFEARTLDDPGLRSYLAKNVSSGVAADSAAAWNLASLTLAAFYFHPDLDVARARWSSAKAGEQVAGARSNPSFTFTPEYKPVPDLSPWTLGYALSIPIETAGKRGYRLGEARALSASARCEIATAAWRVRGGVRSAFLGHASAMRRAEILRAQEALASDVARAMQRRLETGEASRPDADRARQSLDEIRLSIAGAERESAGARAGLASSIGLAPSALDGVRIEPAPPLPALDSLPAMAALREEALSHRADMLALLAEYAASESALQLEIAKQYPDIQLGPGYAWDQGDRKWTLGFSMELPVFNRNEGPIAAAAARREETAARFRALQATVIGAVERSSADYARALHELDAANALVASKRRSERSVEAQFRLGASDRMDLLQARIETNAALLARLDVLAKAEDALGNLEDAVERPLDGPLAPSAEENPRREGGM